MKPFRPLLLAFLLTGCAHADKASVYTEGGIEAAEKVWNANYHEVADACEAKHEPQTPEMEACFGPRYDADAKVETAVRSIVGLLRGYWTARAAGKDPDWGTVLSQITTILDGLPPEAQEIFNNVKGMKL